MTSDCEAMETVRPAGGRWSARPAAACLLTATAFALPTAVSIGVVYSLSRLVPPPASSFARYLAWWAALSGAATLVLLAVGKLSRRLLPLAALLRLALVFPDAAPSRFRTAMGSATVRTLEQRLAQAKEGSAVTPTVAAQRLLALVALLDAHDSLTRGHSDRVRAYAQTIGRELGLKPREVELLNWAALLHDVGKLEVPREILTKDDRPSESEWALLRRHPELGAALAEPLRPWLGDWCDAVSDHHERWDGAGYPRGLAGHDISLAGRIVAVADVFDVITSTRTYKQASSAVHGREELARCAGTQFDPEIVRAFLGVSLRRNRWTTGPLAWLGQAVVLARIPVGSAVGSISAAALAAGAAGSVGLVQSARPAVGAMPSHHGPTVSVRSAPARPAAPAQRAHASGAPPRPRPGKRARAEAAPAPPPEPPAPRDAAAASGTTAGPDRAPADPRGGSPPTTTPSPTAPIPSPAPPPSRQTPTVPAATLPTATVPSLPDTPTLPATTLPASTVPSDLPVTTPNAPSVPSIPSAPVPSAPSPPSAPAPAPSVPSALTGP